MGNDAIIKQWLDGDWPVCFGADVTDEDARKHAAYTLNCEPEDIELLRHNVVLCRYNPKETTDGQSKQLDTGDGDSADTGGGLRVADRAGTGEVTDGR